MPRPTAKEIQASRTQEGFDINTVCKFLCVIVGAGIAYQLSHLEPVQIVVTFIQAVGMLWFIAIGWLAWDRRRRLFVKRLYKNARKIWRVSMRYLDGEPDNGP